MEILDELYSSTTWLNFTDIPKSLRHSLQYESTSKQKNWKIENMQNSDSGLASWCTQQLENVHLNVDALWFSNSPACFTFSSWYLAIVFSCLTVTTHERVSAVLGIWFLPNWVHAKLSMVVLKHRDSMTYWLLSPDLTLIVPSKWGQTQAGMSVFFLSSFITGLHLNGLFTKNRR